MNQEDKELLLKDICGRLWTLNLWVQYKGEKYIVSGYGYGRVSLLTSIFSSITADVPLIEEVKPYLRPMSSMTEEERIEFERLSFVYDTSDGSMLFSKKGFDWLIVHHFDYRGLIPKGLAIAVTEENNPYKNNYYE